MIQLARADCARNVSQTLDRKPKRAAEINAQDSGEENRRDRQPDYRSQCEVASRSNILSGVAPELVREFRQRIQSALQRCAGGHVLSKVELSGFNRIPRRSGL